MASLRTKHLLAPALLLGLLAPVGLYGCGDTSENKTKIEQSGPGSKSVEEKTENVRQSGSNPPLPTGTADAPAPR
jgi:hypothetical protein